MVDILLLIYEKNKPIFPDAMLIHVKLSEALPDHPTFGLWQKQEPLHSIEQCHTSFSILVVSMRIVVINCIRCANFFFGDHSFISGYKYIAHGLLLQAEQATTMTSGVRVWRHESVNLHNTTKFTLCSNARILPLPTTNATSM